jgi:streptogramin lyase
MTPTGAVGRLAPTSGQITEFSKGLTQGKPEGIAAGSDGNLYVTESGNLGAIAQVTPKGTIQELTEGLTPKSEPWAITPGPDGNVYFTERNKPARIGRVATATNAIAPSQPSNGPAPSPPLTEAQLAAQAELGTLAGVTPISGTVLVRNSSGQLVPLGQ